MSSTAQELIAIVESMPEETAREAVDFAGFLQEKSGDAEWERILSRDQAYPKFEQFAGEAFREGKREPLDWHAQ